MALVHTENRVGKPVRINGYQLIPIEKSSRLQPPGMWGVLLWHHPSAVVVQHPDGSNEVIEIRDPTRKAQLILLGIGLIGTLFMLFMNKRISIKH
jgi:hypothetical protein